jgi:hypothetical protein
MCRLALVKRGTPRKQFPLTGAPKFRVTAYGMGASGNDADRCERHPEYIQ